jgi:hypothetical protein
MVRGVSGIVAGGLFVLALVVIGAAIEAAKRDFPGPGGESVTWHIAVLVIGLGAQVFSDRHRGFVAFSGSMVVFVAAGLLLWTQWWG